ncbi:MAG TPA: hypothetical protein VE570_05730 [Thermoleophilaceae bacterium]|nr:hypothetical protein [Thermoleophilaceae bacterium]
MKLAIPDSGAERPVKRIGGQRRRMRLGGQQPSQLLVDVFRADPGGVQELGAVDQRDNRRPGSHDRAAPRRVEPRLDDAAIGDANRDPDQIPASRPTGRARKQSISERATSPRPVEMLLEGTAGVIHDPERNGWGPG